MPDAPKPQAPPPTNTPLIKDPQLPAPPPTVVDQGEADAAKIKTRSTKRNQLQQSSGGAANLRIPLNLGDQKKAKQSLNIPT